MFITVIVFMTMRVNFRIFLTMVFMITSDKVDFTEFSWNHFDYNTVFHIVENAKFSLTEKIFREINSLIFSNFFSKTVDFTKFLSKKYERISVISTLWWINFHENNDWCKRQGAFIPKRVSTRPRRGRVDRAVLKGFGQNSR